MNRRNALTLEYNTAIESFMEGTGFEYTKGTCPELNNQKVTWIEHYDKTLFPFMVENNIKPIANFRAYYLSYGIIVNISEENYNSHTKNVAQWEVSVLPEWLPKEEELI